jgi:dephospho-CoA kinase
MEVKSVTLRVLLITGTVGCGKTSVLLEIGETLASGGVPYAIVDLDWLAWLRPSAASEATVHGVLTENLAHVARTFRAAGVERLALARALRTTGEVEAIRAALGSCELTVVRLVAAPAEIARRLAARDSGAQLAEHLAEAEAFATEAEAAGIGDVTIATDGRPLSTIARTVLERVGWLAPG